MTYSAYLLAYFTDERSEDGERIRFAVSAPGTAGGWIALAGDRSLLAPAIGEGGARDPFLIRDEARDRFVLLATDLRTWPDHDAAWHRATRHGSRSLLVWESADLVDWGEPRLVEVSPRAAGNTWAPKAAWSEERGCWQVFWASALYAERGDRQAFEHQRIMTAFTSDFRDFSPAEVYLDRGHDMIDLVFAQEDGAWYRFCADAEPRGGGPGGFIASETGPGLDDVGWTPLRDGIGSPELVHAEGPAIAPGVDGDWHLLIDEYGERGYQLYHAESLASGSWEHLGTADVPGGARHGSLLPITDDERRRLVGGSG